MHRETLFDADIKLGAGDSESNFEENLNEIQETNQFDANNSVLDNIDEAEESDQNESEEESTCDETSSKEENSEESECTENHPVENFDPKGRGKMNKNQTISDSNDILNMLQSDESISEIRNLKLKTLPEHPREYISLLGPETFIKSAQEPWPNDVKLYQPLELKQILLPDEANCLAVEAFLRMCQLNYQIEFRTNAEAMSPTGKVPFIKCGAFVVSELEGIVQFVNNRSITLTEKLDNEEKYDMRAYMSLIHNVLEKAELYICWMDNDTYENVTCIRHGSVYPWPLNHIQNWSKRRVVMKNLKAWNWCDKKLEEVFQEVENACQALSDRLDNKEYFFGIRTELDALVFGHLYSMCTSCSHSKDFQLILKKFQPLLRHCRKISNLVDKKTDIFDHLLPVEGM